LHKPLQSLQGSGTLLVCFFNPLIDMLSLHTPLLYTGECTISYTHIKHLHTIADSALPWQLGAASAITISCILYILVIVIADTIFWIVVAYGHSEEELGLYAQVQDRLG
jgi:hypothetical protein